MITDFGGDSNGIGALVLQPDGRLVAAGGANDNFALARYQPDGRLDATFGTGGLVTTDVGGLDSISALVLQSDNRLVVAGGDVSGARNFVLVRYQADGQLDATFGTSGVVTTDFNARDNEGIRALVLQPDGRLIAAGTAAGNFGLVRYQADGRLDATFGTGGVVTTDFGGSGDSISALVLQPNNRLVAAGSTAFSDDQGSTQVFALARYQTLDVEVLAAFVTEVYLAALARPPDAWEEAYWVEVLATEPTANTVRGMLHVVFDGPEFRQRPVNPWQYVDALYRAMLGRAPDPAELDWWVQTVLDCFNTLLPGLSSRPSSSAWSRAARIRPP